MGGKEQPKRSGFFQASGPRPILIALAAGLYPLLHYYNGNFDIADSWVQFAFLTGLCLGVPLLLVCVSPYVFRIGFLQKFNKYRLTAINLAVFFGLLGLLIFHFNKKELAVLLLAAVALSFLVYRHLGKVVILQLLLAVMSFVTLIPRGWFVYNYDESWTETPDAITETTFLKTPNVYVIQPDGYTNFSELRRAPYNYNDRSFEDYLTETGFVNYPGFRSNYYSTLTSNSSMFAMKHHYYNNTYPGNLKTFGSQEVIVGEENNVLKTFKHNGYSTYLVTDNSFFLTNRKLSGFDRCNIDQSQVKLYDTGGISGVDIASDFEDYLKDQSNDSNFYFIEKTLPSHIQYTKAASLGVKMERETYLERLERSHEWLQELITLIHSYDDDPMIVLVGDHGGYVGLSYVKEVENKKLSEMEAISVFSTLLSIKWADGFTAEGIDFKSNVNLFRQLFAVMSGDRKLLENLEADASFVPLYEGGSASFYKYIDDKGNSVFQKVEPSTEE
jgi:hypothetical protein